jgi:hypothetical protein
MYNYERRCEMKKWYLNEFKGTGGIRAAELVVDFANRCKLAAAEIIILEPGNSMSITGGIIRVMYYAEHELD